MADRHSSVREGVYAGFIGATAVAVWFLIMDTFGGKPLHTPDILGQGLISILGKMPMMADSMIMRVLAYTIFHYIAFSLVGILVASIVHQSHRTPAILAGFLIAFVAFELGAIGLTTLFTESRFGGMAWYQIFLANLLAAGLMFWFMWRRHPALGHDINVALTGTDDWETSDANPDRVAPADNRR